MWQTLAERLSSVVVTWRKRHQNKDSPNQCSWFLMFIFDIRIVFLMIFVRVKREMTIKAYLSKFLLHFEVSVPLLILIFRKPTSTMTPKSHPRFIVDTDRMFSRLLTSTTKIQIFDYLLYIYFYCYYNALLPVLYDGNKNIHIAGLRVFFYISCFLR